MDAIRAAHAPHHFLSVTKAGHSRSSQPRAMKTAILFCGRRQPNYDAANVTPRRRVCRSRIPARIMIDCSTATAAKIRPTKCRRHDVAAQVPPETRGFRIMVESHLKAGRQIYPGQSACLWSKHHRWLRRLGRHSRPDRRARQRGVNGA